MFIAVAQVIDLILNCSMIVVLNQDIFKEFWFECWFEYKGTSLNRCRIFAIETAAFPDTDQISDFSRVYSDRTILKGN